MGDFKKKPSLLELRDRAGTLPHFFSKFSGPCRDRAARSGTVPGPSKLCLGPFHFSKINPRDRAGGSWDPWRSFVGFGVPGTLGVVRANFEAAFHNYAVSIRKRPRDRAGTVPGPCPRDRARTVSRFRLGP